MKKLLFTGSAVAIVTPFMRHEINFDKFRELLEFHLENKTDAIVVCGTTGESATLNDSEKEKLIEFTVKVIDKRIPVIAGTGSNCTEHSIELSKMAQKLGADGLLLVTPYYNKATQLGLVKHYLAIADSVNLPAMLYNVPARTGVSISAETAKTLSEHHNINSIKEASGNILETEKIACLCRDNLHIYSGNDDITYPILAIGGKGVVSVVANIFPKKVHDLVNEYLCKNYHASLEIQFDMLELIANLFSEVNPIPIKMAMKLLNIDCGELRLPLCEMSQSNTEKLKDALSRYSEMVINKSV